MGAETKETGSARIDPHLGVLGQSLEIEGTLPHTSKVSPGTGLLSAMWLYLPEVRSSWAKTRI